LLGSLQRAPQYKFSFVTPKGLLQQYLPEAEVKTQSTLGGINLGDSDLSTTVQRRSERWSL
jgi:hypothetical protein